MPETLILVVEDEPDLAEALTIVLGRAGHDTITTRLGKEGIRMVHDRRPDLVILDVGLPDIEGWDVLERIRDFSDVPVLMLTARGLEVEKVRGLEAGADDYVTKPFSNTELAARVGALLRRTSAPEPLEPSVAVGSMRIDLAKRSVVVDEADVELTPLEFRLLAALATHRGQVLSQDQLLDLAWNDPYGVGPDRVKFTVARLRKKLAEHGEEPVETVRGFGYRIRG